MPEQQELDPGTPPRARELTEKLRRRRRELDVESYDKIYELCAPAGRDRPARATIGRIFRPDPKAAGLPKWGYYESVLQHALQVPRDAIPEWKAQWDSAQQEWRALKESPAAYAVTTSWPRRRIVRWLAVGAVTVLVIGAGTWLLADELSRVEDDTSPTATGCSAVPIDQLYYTHLYPDWPLNHRPPTSAVVEMHYSPTCRSAWAVLHDAVPELTTATLVRLEDGRQLVCRADSTGSCTTNQLDDAGTTIKVVGEGPDARGETKPR